MRIKDNMRHFTNQKRLNRRTNHYDLEEGNWCNQNNSDVSSNSSFVSARFNSFD